MLRASLPLHTEHEDRPCREAAMQRYAAYLKVVAPHTAPYDLLPAGVHRLDEAEDEETLKLLHILGRHFGDRERTELARGRLYWVAGKTPFGQSLMYGEGSSFAQQYAVLPGEMVNELLVGVQTRGNEDAPYWPQANNTTYKEVRTSSAGRWRWGLAELLAGPPP